MNWCRRFLYRIYRLIFKKRKSIRDEVFYINGSDTLPPPLTKEEEAEAFSLLEKKSPKARETLIVHNLRLVVYIAKKFESSGVGVEDLISIGTIGLIKAVDSFDIERNVRFATYAAKCIDNEILMLFRQDKKKEREVSLNEPIGKDKEGNEISLKDIIGEDSGRKQPDAVEDYMFYEQIKCIYGNIKKVLAPREIEILKYRYGLFGAKECTQNELADRLGISRSYVSRIEKKALGKLRGVLIEQKLM